jgi:hypothetical protein
LFGLESFRVVDVVRVADRVVQVVVETANASPANCTNAAAWRPIRCGRIGGCC